MELKITQNLYLEKVNGGYQICIAMPDQSRNYMHCEILKNIEEALIFMKDLDEITLDSVAVIEDDKYYRIHAVILVDEGNRALHFHSRKLNLNDVIFEKMMIEDAN